MQKSSVYTIDNIKIQPILDAQHPASAIQLNVSWTSTFPNTTLFDVNVVLSSDQDMKFFCKPTVCVKLNVVSQHKIEDWKGRV